MAQGDHTVTLDEVVELARQRSPGDKVRLIERVAPEVERDLLTGSGGSRSLLGLLKDLGEAPSTEEIDEARREVWAGFPRDDT